jgi:hypothetical protein
MNEIARMVVYSRAVTYTEAWNMTYHERKIFMNALKEYVDAKSGKNRTEQL